MLKKMNKSFSAKMARFFPLGFLKPTKKPLQMLHL